MDNNTNIVNPKPKHTLSTISLICSIVCIVLVLASFLPLIGFLTAPLIFPLGIAGIVLGILGIKKEGGHKFAKIGLVLSIVALILNVVITIVMVVIGASLGIFSGLLEASMATGNYYY